MPENAKTVIRVLTQERCVMGKDTFENQGFLKENPDAQSKIPPHELLTRVSPESLKNAPIVDCMPEEDSKTRAYC